MIDSQLHSYSPAAFLSHHLPTDEYLLPIYTADCDQLRSTHPKLVVCAAPSWNFPLQPLPDFPQLRHSPVSFSPSYSLRRDIQSSRDMARKRRSLTNLLIPTFLQNTTASGSTSPMFRLRSKSLATQTGAAPAADPFSDALASFIPFSDQNLSDNLVDDDPFANLSNPRANASAHTFSAPTNLLDTTGQALPSKRDNPQSALRNSPSSPDFEHTRQPYTTPPSPNFKKFMSSGLSRPAYTKPAFKSTPSLPSLRVLAQGEVIPTKKIRRGRVGATLPLEPWNLVEPHSDDQATPDGAGSSWLADLDPPVSLVFGQSHSFDQDQYISAQLYQDNFNLSSDHLPSVKRSLDNPQDSRLSRVPSDPSSSTSWETLSTSDLSHTSSLTVYSDGSDYQPLFSPSSSTHSIQIDSGHGFDISSELYGRGSYSPTSSRSHSISSSSDHEDDDAHLSVQEPEFYPGTSVETIRPRLARSPSAPLGFGFCGDEPILRSVDMSPEVGPTPRNSYLSDSGENWESGTLNTVPDNMSEPLDWMDEAVDGGDKGSRYQGRAAQSSGADHLSTGSGRHSAGRSSGGAGERSGASGGQDDDEDDGRRRKGGNGRALQDFSVTSSFLESDSEEEGDSPKNKLKPATNPPSPQSSDSDDIPLAKSIPTALKAQRTIRREFRDESAQRKQERALRLQQKAQQLPQTAGIVATFSQGLQRSATLARPRTATLPSKPIAMEDLTKKLLNVQATSAAPVASSSNPLKTRRSSTDLDPFGDNVATFDSRDRSVRPMRSFHRPRTADVTCASASPPLPSYSALHSAPLSRSQATTTPRVSGDDRRIDRSKSTRSLRTGYRSGDETSHSSSTEQDTPNFRTEKAPPMPPLPTYESAMSKPKAESLWQQRVFIEDLQRFSMVEISSSSSAQDIIDALESQGEIGGSGWMLFELAQDFGMERPVRSFELLSDITASWNKEKTVNLFRLKRTQLAPLLALSSMPTSSPVFRGYLEYEVKRGKWSKRYVELREHGLWMSKRDSMKDETFLCKLSNFDVYSVTRVQKAPKPFVFAVKSTDSLSLFENTSDYLHTFSCKERDGLEWMSKILLARSYVLHQERRVILPTHKTTPALSRAGTRKSPRPPPHQPLLSVSPPTSSPIPAAATFEPGSLLARRSPA